MRCALLAALVALATTARAAELDEGTEPGNAAPDDRGSLREAVEEYLDGYPVNRPVGKPGDPEIDLDTSFPLRDSVFPEWMPQKIPEFKRNTYEKTRLKLATSYQGIVLFPSDVLFGNNVAAAGFFLFEAQWDAIHQGEDYQGSLIASVFDVHQYGSAAAPALTFAQIGSIVPPDTFYLDIDFFFSNLYWEQWFTKDRLVVRLGNQQPMNVLDFFRYADFRTSFSLNGVGFPAASIPFGPPGLGATVKWWSDPKGGIYVVGNVTDINSEIDELDWGNIFDTGDLFAGVEVGHNWKSMGETGPSLDHVHLTVFYADEPSRKPFPAESGWGFKVAGEKQWGPWVAFANYTYNTAKGGGFGFTFAEHTVNVGGAYSKPLGIRGEIAAVISWLRMLDGGNCGAVPCNGANQWATEVYWKILLAPDLWITPGIQFHFDPAFNPTESLIVIPMFKFRLFF